MGGMLACGWGGGMSLHCLALNIAVLIVKLEFVFTLIEDNNACYITSKFI